ncbi:MAG: type III-B CRISPR module-associated protein Cmr5 [Chthonomonadales bacterium]
MKTRAQNDLILAERLVAGVAEKYPDKGHQVRKIYGGLCHSFPVMVRTCGLCQALAFSEAKAKGGEGSRAEAHALLLQHVAELIGANQSSPLGHVRKAKAIQYMLYTRRVLDAWIYFKRFAESILEVKSAKEAEDVEQ